MEYDLYRKLSYGEQAFSIIERTETLDTEYFTLRSDCQQHYLRLRYDTKDDRWFMHRSWPGSSWDEVNIDEKDRITFR